MQATYLPHFWTILIQAFHLIETEAWKKKNRSWVNSLGFEMNLLGWRCSDWVTFSHLIGLFEENFASTSSMPWILILEILFNNTRNPSKSLSFRADIKLFLINDSLGQNGRKNENVCYSIDYSCTLHVVQNAFPVSKENRLTVMNSKFKRNQFN